MNTSTNNGAEQPLVYRMDGLHRWTLCGGALLIAAVPLVGAVDLEAGYQLLPALIASAVVAPIALVLVWLSRRARLELSQAGLWVSRPGLSIRVGWADIERIAIEPGLLGVVLKQPWETPAMQRERWLATRSSYDASNYSAEQLQLIRELRFINLSGFGRQLRSDVFLRAALPFGVKVTGHKGSMSHSP